MTTAVDTQKEKEEELDRLMDAINKEERIRREKIKEQIEKLKTYQTEFLTKCESLARQFISIPEGVNIHKPLDKKYQVFESLMSKFKEQLQERK